MNELIEIKAQGAVMRTRSNWQFHAEKPTKYFLNLEKSNFNRKTIHRLILDNGEPVIGRKQVLGKIRSYYDRLYTSCLKVDKTFVNGLDIPQIPDDLKSELDEDVTVFELGLALKQLKNSKCLGTDGISVNFLKMFWCKLKHLYKELVDDIIKDRKMHLTARQGVL